MLQAFGAEMIAQRAHDRSGFIAAVR